MRFSSASSSSSFVVVLLFYLLASAAAAAVAATASAAATPATSTGTTGTTETNTNKKFLREQQKRNLVHDDNDNHNVVRRNSKAMEQPLSSLTGSSTGQPQPQQQQQQQQQQQRVVSVDNDYNKKKNYNNDNDDNNDEEAKSQTKTFNNDNNDNDNNQNNQKKETKIVGGEESTIGQFPYFVDMNIIGCGGSLIAPRVVLTAAHCDDSGTRWLGRNVLVGAYEDNESSDENNPHLHSVQVDRQIVHPDYTVGHSFNNDFQLLRLARPVYIEPPLLSISRNNDFYHPQEDTDLTVLGVGRLSSGGARPDNLQHVEVPVVNIDECNTLYNNGGGSVVGETMFCAGNIPDGGIDSCQGDSGGPIVHEKSSNLHIQEGVVSWGYGCARPNFPGVYAKVGSIYPWIYDVVCEQWNVGSDFCGPTDPPTPTQPPSESPTETPLDCGNDQLVDFRFNTDDWGSETSFEIRNLITNQIIDDGLNSYGNNEEYKFENCIDPSLCYKITIYDTQRDGFCCGGDPYIQVIVDGEIVVDLSSANEMRFGSSIEFDIGDGCGDDFTQAPTTSPTEFTCNDNTIIVDWIFNTDDWGQETWWEITNAEGNVMTGGGRDGSYGDDQRYQFLTCLPADNCYTVTLGDTNNDGFCCEGNPMYELIVEGETLWYGSGNVNWGSSIESQQFGNSCQSNTGGSTDGDGDDGSNDGDGTSSPVTSAPVTTAAPVTAPPTTSPPNTPPPPPIEGLCADDSDMHINFKFETDGYAAETSWELVDNTDGTTIASSGSTRYQNFFDYEQSSCVARAGRCYNLTLFDSWGDGFCCGGSPYYQVDVDGVTIVGPIYQDDFGYETSFQIGEGCDDQDGTGTSPENVNCGEMELEVDADGYGEAISVIVFDGFGNTVVERNGFMDNFETIITEDCIDTSDCSLLRVSDNSSGNTFGGTVVVKLDGAVLYEGSNFGDGFEVRMGSACTVKTLGNHYQHNYGSD